MRSSSSPRGMPPPLELECLKALWKLGEANVGDVRGEVSKERELAYTTIMTLLDRLVRRGSARRRKVGRSFRYSASVPRDAIRQSAVNSLLDSHFNGSKEELLAYLNNGVLPPPEQHGLRTLDGKEIEEDDSNLDPSLL